MGTKKEARVKELREQYGDNYKLFIFSWRQDITSVGGHIMSIPANDAKTAFLRLLQQHKTMKYEWQGKLIARLYRKGLLKKYIKCHVVEYDEPMTYFPMTPR